MSNIFHKKNQTIFKFFSTLNTAQKKQKYIIVRTCLPDDKCLRPAELGLVEGTTVQVERSAPTGSPVQIDVAGYSLCLRSDRADCIKIVPQIKEKQLTDLSPPSFLSQNTSTQTASQTFTIALFGNPNSGKTTLFNKLTGQKRRVGNRPGVTVDNKKANCVLAPQTVIVDTPGVYSLLPNSPDEQAALNCLREKPSIILNVIDCCNLRRSLYLTTQLVASGVPVVVALNMKDEADRRGIQINEKILAKSFGCPFKFVSADKNRGVAELVNLCVDKARKSVVDSNSAAINETQYAKQASASQTKEPKTNHAKSDNTQQRRCNNICTRVCAHAHTRARKSCQHATTTAEIADTYSKIDTLVSVAVKHTSQKPTATQKIDNVVLNKWIAFPLALLTLFVLFAAANVPSRLTTAFVTNTLTPWLQSGAKLLLNNVSNYFLTDFVCEGVIGGVASVLGFAPQIMILYGCIAALEACGYLARIAFATDDLLSKIGLSGRSVVSIALGCGCSVPAIMSARVIGEQTERNATITLTPFMPCSAKLTIISFFASYVFDGSVLVAISFYLLSVATITATGLVLKLVRKDVNEELFLMEMPPYRLPQTKDILLAMLERGKSFVTKTGTSILVSSVVLWTMQKLDFSLSATEPNKSMLASIGKFLVPVFAPIGFDEDGYGWQLTVATLSGISAKETVIATLQILLQNGANCLSRLSAYSFVAYNLLCAPCVAAISASFAEQGIKNGLKSLAVQLAVAYCVSLVIYQGGHFAKNNPIAFGIISAAIVSIAVVVSSAILKKQAEKRPSSCKPCDDDI